jgi:hypothetical protein
VVANEAYYLKPPIDSAQKREGYLHV